MSTPSARRWTSAPSERYPKVVVNLNDPRRGPDCPFGLIASRARVDSAFQCNCPVRYGNLDRLAIKLRDSFQRLLNSLFDVSRLWRTLERNVVDDSDNAAQFAHRILGRVLLILPRHLTGKAHPPAFHRHFDALAGNQCVPIE